MSSKNKKIIRLGEETYNSQGIRMKIVRYGANNDIDVAFDDGVVLQHKTYQSFKNGGISHPNKLNSRCINRLGEERINRQGLSMKIIKYNRNNDIDVQFTDGYIAKNKMIKSFDSGGILNPNYDNPQIINMIGQRVGRLLVVERGEDRIAPKTNKRIVTWKCLCDCGNIITVAGSALRGKNPTQSCGCLQRERTINAHLKTVESYDDELKQINPLIIRIGEFTKRDEKTEHQCLVCGHIWETTPSKVLSGRGCPNCFNRYKTSFPEQAVYYYIKQVYKDAINQYQDLENNITEIDVFIPSLRLGIEYDGRAWHQNQDRDEKKYQSCIKNNMTLIRISEIKVEKSALICDKIFYTDPCHASDYTKLNESIKELFCFLNLPYDHIDCNKDNFNIKQQYYTILKENSLASKCPDKAQYWDYEKNGNITPDMVSNNSNDKYWVKCRECGDSFKTQMNVFSQSQGWCKKCSMKNGTLKITSIPVYCVELNMAFPSEMAAGRFVGISNSTIRAVFNGRQSHAGRHPSTGERLTWEKWTLEQYEEWCNLHKPIAV